MLWLAVVVAFLFIFMAPIALGAACKVVVLALAADPAAIWEVEVAVGLLALVALLLVLGPFGRAGVHRGVLLENRRGFLGLFSPEFGQSRILPIWRLKLLAKFLLYRILNRFLNWFLSRLLNRVLAGLLARLLWGLVG